MMAQLVHAVTAEEQRTSSSALPGGHSTAMVVTSPERAGTSGNLAHSENVSSIAFQANPCIVWHCLVILYVRVGLCSDQLAKASFFLASWSSLDST